MKGNQYMQDIQKRYTKKIDRPNTDAIIRFKTMLYDAVETGEGVTDIIEIALAVERGETDRKLKSMINSLYRKQKRKGRVP